MFTSSWGPGHTGSLHSQRAITGWRMPFPPKAPVCVPPWQTQPESRDARGAMDSRGLVWSQQQKIPRFQAVGRYTTATYHRPTVTAFDREKRKKKTKPLANHRTTVGCFLEHLSVQCSKGTLPSEFTWKFAPTTTSQQIVENQNPTLRIHVTCMWKMKGSQAGCITTLDVFLWTHSSLLMFRKLGSQMAWFARKIYYLCWSFLGFFGLNYFH